MPDQIVFSVLGVLSTLSIFFGGVSAYYAYKNSERIETELRMVFWGIGAIAGLVFGGLIWAWFLIPIIENHI
jgi:hypothetical protein